MKQEEKERREEEKKKTDQMMIAMIHEDMARQIDALMRKYGDKVDALQTKMNAKLAQKENLDALAILVENRTFDASNPEHRAILEGSGMMGVLGVNNASEFEQKIDEDPDAVGGAIENAQNEVSQEISDLANQIQAVLEKIAILEEAQALIKNGKLEEAQQLLQDNNIDVGEDVRRGVRSQLRDEDNKEANLYRNYDKLEDNNKQEANKELPKKGIEVENNQFNYQALN